MIVMRDFKGKKRKAKKRWERGGGGREMVELKTTLKDDESKGGWLLFWRRKDTKWDSDLMIFHWNAFIAPYRAEEHLLHRKAPVALSPRPKQQMHFQIFVMLWCDPNAISNGWLPTNYAIQRWILEKDDDSLRSLYLYFRAEFAFCNAELSFCKFGYEDCRNVEMW